MAIPLIPWESHVFPAAIQTELRRRAKNRGMNPVISAQTTWQHNNDDGGEWESYRGPMTAWARVCSNGYGIEHENPSHDMPGFVFYGGKDFYTSYGINGGVFNSPRGFASNQTILGYTPDGMAHIIENDKLSDDYPIHVPNPEIEKISATIQKEILRRVRIEWTCFSFKQLEYMTPYFLVPGISVIVEWGWNHFNPASLLDLDNEDELARLYNNPYPLYTDNILASKGNYEVLFGIVTNFEWSIDGNKIRCVTEVTSKDRIWAGQIVNENMVEKDESLANDEKPVRVVDSLKQFVTSYIAKFYDLIDPTKSADSIIEGILGDTNNPLQAFIKYVKDNHPTNYKEYLFGLFYGRDEKTVSLSKAVDGDFDYQKSRTHLWINMGLIIEIINFHSSQLKGVKDEPLFRIDVDDCVISAHPNLISSNGNILLIPNAKAPKYFSGLFGMNVQNKKEESQAYNLFSSEMGDYSDEYKKKMTPCGGITKAPKVKDMEEESKLMKREVSLRWADRRLKTVLSPLLSPQIQRDNLSSIINSNRIRFSEKSEYLEFPFDKDYEVEEGGSVRRYDRYFTGFFRNLYLNVSQLKEAVEDERNITYRQVLDDLFNRMNSAASDFWSFKLVGSTGRYNTTGLATMKIVDDKMGQYTSNEGEIFTFDYYAADGLLQSVGFRPMLSNAQAIRTIYAQNEVNANKAVGLSGANQLLDYKFKDRLSKTNNKTQNKKPTEIFRTNSFKSSLEKLQALRPPDNKSFQMTVKSFDGEEVIFRLAIPNDNAEVLSLILDDNDKELNPRYCGIMPGIQAEFTIQGIAGIRTFAMFRVRGLPEPYSENNIVFRVINVNDTVQNGQWTTTIIAGVLPLRAYFCSKLGLSPKLVSNKKS